MFRFLYLVVRALRASRTLSAVQVLVLAAVHLYSSRDFLLSVAS